MPLQIEVGRVSVQARVPGYVIALNLTCWPDGVVKEYPEVAPDGTVDMKNAVIYQDFPGILKAKSNGMTKEERVQETAVRIKNSMQSAIDKYIDEDELLNSALFESVRAGIETALVG